MCDGLQPALAALPYPSTSAPAPEEEIRRIDVRGASHWNVRDDRDDRQNGLGGECREPIDVQSMKIEVRSGVECFDEETQDIQWGTDQMATVEMDDLYTV